jgi:hypothetical protein
MFGGWCWLKFFYYNKDNLISILRWLLLYCKNNYEMMLIMTLFRNKKNDEEEDDDLVDIR